MGVVVAEGDQPESQGAAIVGHPRPHSPAPPSVRLESLVILDTSASEPVAIEALFFADEGIGVIRNRGERPRVLPWSALSAHAVEQWVGGEIPADWLLQSPEGAGQEPWVVPTPVPPPRLTAPRGCWRPDRHPDLVRHLPFPPTRAATRPSSPAAITAFAVRHRARRRPRR